MNLTEYGTWYTLKCYYNRPNHEMEVFSYKSKSPIHKYNALILLPSEVVSSKLRSVIVFKDHHSFCIEVDYITVHIHKEIYNYEPT